MDSFIRQRHNGKSSGVLRTGPHAAVGPLGCPRPGQDRPRPLLSVSPKHSFALAMQEPPAAHLESPTVFWIRKAESWFSPQAGVWGEEKAQGVALTCQLCKASLQNQGPLPTHPGAAGDPPRLAQYPGPWNDPCQLAATCTCPSWATGLRMGEPGRLGGCQ